MPGSQTTIDAGGGGFYADAAVYDALHTPGTAGEVTGLARLAERFVKGRADHWLEPACGTGRYLRVAAARGRRVTGFDLDAALVDDARARFARRGLAARADLFVADMTDFAGRVRTRADFAFCTINTVRHLASDGAMHAHLREVAAILRGGGVYALGVSTTMYGVEAESEDVWHARRGGLRVTQTVQYLPPEPGGRFETVVSHLVLHRGGASEHRDSVYRLRTYDLAQWKRMLARSAMEVVACVDEDGRDVAEPAMGYAVWVLRPRG